MILSQTRRRAGKGPTTLSQLMIQLYPTWTWPSLYITSPELFVGIEDAAYPFPNVKRLCRSLRLGLSSSCAETSASTSSDVELLNDNMLACLLN